MLAQRYAALLSDPGVRGRFQGVPGIAERGFGLNYQMTHFPHSLRFKRPVGLQISSPIEWVIAARAGSNGSTPRTPGGDA